MALLSRLVQSRRKKSIQLPLFQASRITQVLCGYQRWVSLVAIIKVENCPEQGGDQFVEMISVE